MRICIIDDEKISLNVIRAVLSRSNTYDLEGYKDPNEALDRCRQITFDLVLVDYRMVKMDGLHVVEALRSMEAYAHVPIIMLTADNDRDLRIAAVSAGATDFLNKPFDPEELRVRVRNLVALREAQIKLQDRARHLDAEVKKATRTLADREEELIWRLSRAIETRDGATGEHVGRVATVARCIAKNLGLDAEYCRLIYLSSPLHDAGKIGISDAVLNKPGRLDADEMKEIRRHIEIGASILENGQSSLVRMAYEIAVYHHEKWDGTGYSRGLARDDIPLSARIVAVADVFDALCSERTYKAAWSFDAAYAEILRQSGKHFDPKCVTAFQAGIDEIRHVFSPTDEPVGIAVSI